MLQDNFQIYWEKKNRPKSIKIPETYTREEIICFSSQAIYISLLLGYFHKKNVLLSRAARTTRETIIQKNKFLSGGETRPER